MFPALAFIPLFLVPPVLPVHDPVPICETVVVMENSGNGPTYPIELCGDKALPIHRIIVDGSALPEHSITHRRITFWYRH
jgi:hypothetical protein